MTNRFGNAMSIKSAGYLHFAISQLKYLTVQVVCKIVMAKVSTTILLLLIANCYYCINAVSVECCSRNIQ